MSQPSHYQTLTSTRLVKVKVDAAHFEAAAKFWLAPYQPTPAPSKHLVDPALYR